MDTLSPGLQRHLLLGVERLPREAAEADHEAGVHHVAAVAPPVALHQVDRRRRAAPSPSIFARARVPFQNSTTMVVRVNGGEREGQQRVGMASCRATQQRDPHATPTASGSAKLRLRLRGVALRQAITGPTPIRKSRISPRGMFTRL